MSDDEKKLDKDVNPKKKHQAQLKKLEDQIVALEAEVTEWKNKYVRVHADMDNARKQNAKDYQTYMKYRAVPFIEKLLPSLDIFGQVLRNEPDNEVLRNYLTGFKFIYTHIVEALTSEGLQEITVEVGAKFDEKTMHAIEVEYREDIEPNIITAVRNNTFMFVDRLIRPAQVTVSTNIKEKEPTDETDHIDPTTLS